MWTLAKPEALLNFYEYNEEPVYLGNSIHLSSYLNKANPKYVNILIPYRFGMDLHEIKKMVSPLLDDDDLLFFLDSLKIKNQNGDTHILRVPHGIICEWFLKTTGNIESHSNKLVFIDSCPHTWAGIDNVFIITVGIKDNDWSQQSLGEPGFIKDYLENKLGLHKELSENWGNDLVELGLSNSGDQLTITSGIDGNYKYSISCLWVKDRWVIDHSKI